MKIIKKFDELNKILEPVKYAKKSIGLVLTMGNIHQGHLSLVDKARSDNEFVVVSIFINPTQFNNKDDFNYYPRTLNADIEKLELSNCDLLFLPEITDIYPNGFSTEKTILKYRNILCDKFRPGHFEGVTTVVDVFFELIKPTNSYFGEKDFQQLKLVTELVKTKKYNINIVSCLSIRDQYGMSLASRNTMFTEEQQQTFKQLSEKIYNFINLLKQKKIKLDFQILKKDLLNINISKIDYLEIRDEKDLQITNSFNDSRLFIALYIDQVRIIDNFKLN
tara:strand:- start:342 stop:1175 length:834 start_codon:yes stop_codon:yes gene_type:complete